jgi:hypothetical protein
MIDWMMEETQSLHSNVCQLKEQRQKQEVVIKNQQKDIEYMTNLIKSYETEMMKLKARLSDKNINFTQKGYKFNINTKKECMNDCGFTVNISEKSDYCDTCREHTSARKKGGKSSTCGYCMSGTVHLNQECIYA